MPVHDLKTRRRLLESGARLFAARGFTHVTVREICTAAGANVAAVNYHFGDKLGLYVQVVRAAIDAMRTTSEAVRQPNEPGSAEDRLRRYIRVFLRRVAGRESWIHQLMAREMADPTPALDLIVEQAIRPRMLYLIRLVAELLECSAEDERAIRCAASVQAQCLSLLPNPVGKRLRLPPRRRGNEAELEAVVQHVAEFSLAGIRAVATTARACVRAEDANPPAPAGR
jgi:TetR/AcrR family transcriptional regulator, regulator of cefoperazone and chloramphenicol sensitivity